jgi:hypothetical protein
VSLSSFPTIGTSAPSKRDSNLLKSLSQLPSKAAAGAAAAAAAAPAGRLIVATASFCSPQREKEENTKADIFLSIYAIAAAQI